jgi:hypothetical protein
LPAKLFTPTDLSRLVNRHRGQARAHQTRNMSLIRKAQQFCFCPEGVGVGRAAFRLPTMGSGAAPNQTPRCVKPAAFSGFTTAARQIVGKPTPTASGQNQKQRSRSRFAARRRGVWTAGDLLQGMSAAFETHADLVGARLAREAVHSDGSVTPGQSPSRASALLQRMSAAHETHADLVGARLAREAVHSDGSVTPGQSRSRASALLQGIRGFARYQAEARPVGADSSAKTDCQTRDMQGCAGPFADESAPTMDLSRC